MSLLLQDTLVISPSTVDRIEGEIDTVNERVDLIEASSDCADVVGTKAELDSYDKSKLTDKAVIKVLQDETQEYAQTYYRYSKPSNSFTLIGELGPFYTKAESDNLLNSKVNKVTTANKIYGTDATGAQIVYDKSDFNKQYNYTAELEFEPSSELISRRLVIKGQPNRCSIAYIRVSVSDYYTDTNEWGKAQTDCEYLGILQPTQVAEYKGCSSIISLQPYQSIYIEGGASEDNGSPFITFDLYYNQSDWSESKCRFIFEISCDEQVEIITTDDHDEYSPDFLGKNIMCVPTPMYDPNSTEEKYLADEGGVQRWKSIPNDLPSQTGQSGKFLTTDGTDASWSDKPLINQLAGGTLPTGSVGIKTYVYNNDCVAINSDTVLGANGVTLIGKNAFANSSDNYAVGIGYGARLNAPNAILINASGTNQYNDTANTFKIGNTNGVFEMMSADGTIPTARLTKVNTTITLAAADWSSNTQTVSVTGMTATGVVFISPDPSDQSDYTSAGILCTAQAAGTLTFTCNTVPSGDLSVNVVCL